MGRQFIGKADPKSGDKTKVWHRLTRRRFIWMVNAAVATGIAGKLFWNFNEGFLKAAVFVAKAVSYETNLEQIVRSGLEELGLERRDVRGKSILLKPNLVEPDSASPHINTHPALVRAAAEVFRVWDAKEVFVAEGPGHVRDTQLVLDNSGFGTMLTEAGIPFVDLNYDNFRKIDNKLGLTSLSHLYLPESLFRADLIVSMPKMKTHHWAGFTLSMKNLFGVMPGLCYGWPKNVLHLEGISKAILDITSTVQPDLAIVDGIVGMEGDGPIMGTPKPAGVVVMGTNPTSVDATAVRLMGFDPYRANYLAYAAGVLGPVAESNIEQRGEPLASLVTSFKLLDHPSMLHFRS